MSERERGALDLEALRNEVHSLRRCVAAYDRLASEPEGHSLVAFASAAVERHNGYEQMEHENDALRVKVARVEALVARWNGAQHDAQLQAYGGPALLNALKRALSGGTP